MSVRPDSIISCTLTDNPGLDTGTDMAQVAELDLPVFSEAGNTSEMQPGAKEAIGEQGTADLEIMVPKKPPKEEYKPFLLCDSLPAVPAKLVKRILKGEYVEMSELLKDNLEADRRRSLIDAGCPAHSHMGQFSRREIPDALSWLYCFGIYAAIICSKWPGKHRQLFAYQVLILNESRRGGRGWLMYDAALRQQITDLETFDFAKINQSLYATTCLQYAGAVRACPLCGLGDHSEGECALRPQRSTIAVGTGAYRDEGMRRGQDLPKKRFKRGPCFDYNGARGCNNSSCIFEHCCSRCRGDHRSIDCAFKPPPRKESKPEKP